MAAEVFGLSPEHTAKADFMEAHADGFARRLVKIFGGGDYEKGLEIWIQRGYRDHFLRMLDGRDPELYKSMVDGYLLPIITILEEAGKSYKKDTASKTKQDPVLVTELEQLGERSGIKQKAAIIGLGLGLSTFLALVSHSLTSPDSNSKTERFKDAKVEGERSKVVFDYDHLLQLDSSAAPEILARMEQTWPKSFTNGNIFLVDFKDQKLYSDPSYGLAHTENAATAEGGVGSLGTDIIFWRGMQGPSISTTFMGREIIVWWRAEVGEDSSEQIWNTILHEGGHAIDWIRAGNLSESEREELRKEVYARVQADDRYKSGYVEAITNKDKAVELSTKAIEYWAEIVEAYLTADPNLPEADAKLVAKYLAKDDPNFDRDKALQARLAIFQEMRQMKIARGFKNLSPLMHDRYQSWIIQHHSEGGGLTDMAKQRLGRVELVSFLRTNLTKEERSLVMAYINFCKWREGVNAIYKSPTPKTAAFKDAVQPIEAWHWLLINAKNVEKLASPVEEKRAVDLLSEVDRIINHFDLDISSFRGGRMSEDEKYSLFPELNPADLELLDLTDWDGNWDKKMGWSSGSSH